MNFERTGPAAFTVSFDDLEDLRREERLHLAAGGLLLRPAEPLPPFAPVELTLRVVGGGTATTTARVVGTPAGGLALQVDGVPATLLAALATAPPPPAAGEDDGPPGTAWERVRGMTPPQKTLLAPKADRTTRALLLQDSDPQVLFALLKNPRLGLDEVVRAAKSSALGFQAAELILKTQVWAANVDVRVALIHNPKLPLPIALRILPTLPDPEVRAIAKGAATSAALKQAALRRVTGG